MTLFSRSISRSCEINAPADEVWRVFADFDTHSEWNPMISELKGPLKKGKQFRVRLKMTNGREQSFRPVLLNNKKNSEFRWRGKVLLPGLFDGEHVFQLVPIDKQTTRFIQSEYFSGLLVPFVGWAIDDAFKGFDLMNLAIKKRVEEG